MPILGREVNIRIGGLGTNHMGKINWGYLPTILSTPIISCTTNIADFHRHGEVFSLVDFRPKNHVALLMLGGELFR